MSVPKSELITQKTEDFRFGTLYLRADGILLRRDKEIHLTPRELAALRVLLAHAGELVTPAQLQRAIWGDVHVTADSVPRCVSSLRAALEPDDCIQTVYKRGYRLTGSVERRWEQGKQPRLAIMPFATAPNLPSYLGSAVAEETIAMLSNAAWAQRPVAVLARDSVFAVAQQGHTAQELGTLLGADFVLTGDIRMVAAQYRLRAELVRVEDHAQVWLEDFLVPLARIAGLEGELVQRLAARLRMDSLRPVVGPGHSELADSDPARSEAYDRFQRARQELQSVQRHRMQDGLQNLLRATELDPSLLAAQLDLANACITQSLYGYISPATAAEQVRRTARIIPARSESGRSLLPSLGWVRFHVDRNLEGALQAFEESTTHSYDPWATRSRVMVSLSRHRFIEAIDLLHEALDADPYSPWMHARLAWALHLTGDNTRSLAQIEQALPLFPNHEGIGLYGTAILAYNGLTAQALELGGKLVRNLPYCDVALAAHGYALACAGKHAEAAEIVERLQWMSRERFVDSSFTPAVCVELGDLDLALTELRNAEETRCPWFFQVLADPRLKPLHGMPEFEQMRGLLGTLEELATRSVHSGSV